MSIIRQLFFASLAVAATAQTTPTPSLVCPPGTTPFSFQPVTTYTGWMVGDAWPARTCSGVFPTQPVQNGSVASEVQEAVTVFDTHTLAGRTVVSARYVNTGFFQQSNDDRTAVNGEYVNKSGDPTVSCADWVPPPVGSNAFSETLADAITDGYLNARLRNLDNINTEGFTRVRTGLSLATLPTGQNDLSWNEAVTRLVGCTTAAPPCVVDVPITGTYRDGWTNSGNAYTWTGDTSVDCHDHVIEDETFYAFDMTPLGGGTPVNAELHVFVVMKWLPNPLELRADYYRWPYPQGTDAAWKAAYGVPGVEAIRGIDVATLGLNVWNVLSLDGIGGINSTGTTWMRVGCDPLQTTVYSEVDFASFDSAPSGRTPFLRITYIGGKCPTDRTPVVPVTPVPTSGAVVITCPNGVAVGAICTVTSP